MNKTLLLSIVAASASIFISQDVFGSSSFAKLTPLITQKADILYTTLVKPLKEEDQQIFLNFLALINTPITNDTPAEIIEFNLKCGEHLEAAIEANPALVEVVKKFNADLDEIFLLYAEFIKSKVAQKNIETKNMSQFLEKFQQKTAELISYIIKLYYYIIYGQTKKETSVSLTYMFDSNGTLPVTKRTQPLPVPTE